jgi:hypothetical protein
MAARSEKASDRFLEVALDLGPSNEPIGRPASVSRERHAADLELPILLSPIINVVCTILGNFFLQNRSCRKDWDWMAIMSMSVQARRRMRRFRRAVTPSTGA